MFLRREIERNVTITKNSGSKIFTRHAPENSIQIPCSIYYEWVYYVNDNTLIYFSTSLPQLIDVLDKEASIALTRLDRNEMIANPEKFHTFTRKKDQTKTTWHGIQGNFYSRENDQI